MSAQSMFFSPMSDRCAYSAFCCSLGCHWKTPCAIRPSHGTVEVLSDSIAKLTTIVSVAQAVVVPLCTSLQWRNMLCSVNRYNARSRPRVHLSEMLRDKLNQPSFRAGERFELPGDLSHPCSKCYPFVLRVAKVGHVEDLAERNSMLLFRWQLCQATIAVEDQSRHKSESSSQAQTSQSRA